MRKPPLRFWIAVMIFFTTFTNYMLRSNINVSILGMVDRETKNFTPICLINKTRKAKPKVAKVFKGKKFDWDENEVGTILGAYFWGYLLTSMPGGILAELFGPWHVILWSSVAGGIFTAFTPLSTALGPWGVVVNRFLIGLVGGVAYPAVNVLIAKWAPPKEKGKFLGAMMGNTLGTVVAFNLVGQVTARWGWDWGFYVLVFCMALFCVAFAFIAADSPHKHRWISEEEKAYIAEMQGGHVSQKKKVPPYRAIFRSFPFWIAVTAQFGNLWGLNLSMSYAPKYTAEVLGFELKESAGIAALPNLARLICSNMFGVVGDLMLKKEIMSTNKCRKFFIIFSHFLPGLLLAVMPAVGCHEAPAVSFLVLSLASNGAVVVSSLINPQDLAPNFAGTVYGMMNLFGMTSGIMVPQLTGLFNAQFGIGFKAASYVFGLGAVVYWICGGAFIVFGTSQVQPWNQIKEDAT